MQSNECLFNCGTSKERNFKPKVSLISTTKKNRKPTVKAVQKTSHEEAALSQEVLQMTETEICGICFREDDKGDVGDVIFHVPID